MIFEMRNLILMAILLIGMADARDVDWKEWKKEREADLAASRMLPDEGRIPILGKLVMASGRRDGYRPWPEMDSVKAEFLLIAQNELLAIPGHARYYAAEVERLIEDPKNVGNEMDLRQRGWFIEDTLGNLPSPETISVLGNYLSDERGLAKVPSWDGHGQLWGLSPNCVLALRALKQIGLRDLGFAEPELRKEPVSSEYATLELRKQAWFDYYTANHETQLKPWRAWWEEIKSGRRSFSFKGQAVEYRFKPDGTWETLAMAAPPDDAPKPASTAVGTEKRTHLQETEAIPPQGSPWAWFVGVAVVLLSGLGWLAWRKFSTRTG
jgi:hypothetical protein